MFDNLDGTRVEYTLRLSHEVGSDNSWETANRGPSIQLPGSRVSPKWVTIAFIHTFLAHTPSTIYSFYLEEGFLHLQNAVGLSIIEKLANKTIDLQVSVEVCIMQYYDQLYYYLQYSLH